jgi:hypothetical protein
MYQEVIMSAFAKEKPDSVLPVGTALFERLGALFAKSATPSAKSIATEVRRSVRQLRQQSSPAELRTLRLVVNELAAQMEHVLPRPEDDLPKPVTQSELARATSEDAFGDAVLAAALHHGRKAMVTQDSIEQGNASMALADQIAGNRLDSRIDNKALINSGALQRALNVQRQAISGAMKAGRLFAFVGPSGENFYPAFYADPALDRRAIERVSKTLGTLPAASKYYFFTENSTLLGETPLEALRKGRLAEVLIAATGFVER